VDQGNSWLIKIHMESDNQTNVHVCVLWRFYSNNSNFIHGGMDGRPDEQQAVTGQAVSISPLFSY